MSIVKRISESESDLIDFLRENSESIESMLNYRQLDFSVNFLKGEESDVIKSMIELNDHYYPDSPEFFKDMNDTLIKNSIRLIKRLLGENASLYELNTFIQDKDNKGHLYLNAFRNLKSQSDLEEEENKAIYQWFLDEYFNKNSKMFGYCSGFRTIILKINSKDKFDKIINPSKNTITETDAKIKAFELTKLIKRLGQPKNKNNSLFFHETEISPIVNSLKNGQNVSIVGPAGVGKTTLLKTISDAVENDFEILILNGSFQDKSDNISKIKSFLDLSTEKKKLLVMDDLYSLNMINCLDYALISKVQILLAVQGNSLGCDWKRDLSDIYYPKSIKDSSELITSEFQEFGISKERKINHLILW